MNPNFNTDAINELNKIKPNMSINKQTLRKSPQKRLPDSPHNHNFKEDDNLIQNLNIEFIEKLNKNGGKADNEVLAKLNKFREYMKKQNEYLENTKKNNEIKYNIQTDQLQESNLRLNLADNVKHSDKKNKNNKAGSPLNNKKL